MIEKTENIADIIRHMPVNKKLYSIAHGVVTFKGFSDDGNYIVCECEPDRTKLRFRLDGKLYENGECILYPDKDSNGWEDWPKYLVCRGDVLCSQANKMKSIYVVKGTDGERHNVLFYCHTSYGKVFYDNDDLMNYGSVVSSLRFASLEEIEELIYAAKEKGYTLDFNNIECKKSFMKKIKSKNYPQENLKPFDKILTRCTPGQKWNIDLFGYIGEDGMFNTMACGSRLHMMYVIPYNDETKHLLGTSDLPPEKYRVDS